MNHGALQPQGDIWDQCGMHDSTEGMPEGIETLIKRAWGEKKIDIVCKISLFTVLKWCTFTALSVDFHNKRGWLHAQNQKKIVLLTSKGGCHNILASPWASHCMRCTQPDNTPRGQTDRLTDQNVFDVCCKQRQCATFVRHCSYYLTDDVLHTHTHTDI